MGRRLPKLFDPLVLMERVHQGVLRVALLESESRQQDFTPGPAELITNPNL